MTNLETPGKKATEQSPEELRGKKEIALKIKPRLAEVSAEVAQTGADEPKDEEIGVEQGGYIEWVEESITKEETPLSTEKRKILEKIKKSKKITQEEANQLLDKLVSADTIDEVTELKTSL